MPLGVNLFTSEMSHPVMPDLGGGLRGCYRCAYVWRPTRGGTPKLCARCKSRYWDTPLIRPLRTGRRKARRRALERQRAAVLELARRRGFEHIRLFGSVRRDEATSASDVDLLVAPTADASIFDQIELKSDLERLLRRKVDVVTDEGLHWLIRPQVLFEAIPL